MGEIDIGSDDGRCYMAAYTKPCYSLWKGRMCICVIYIYINRAVYIYIYNIQYIYTILISTAVCMYATTCTHTVNTKL